MIKTTFIYLVIIVFVGVAAWFFVNKAKNASQVSDIVSLVAESATPSPSPEIMEETTKKEEAEWVKLANGLEYQDVVIGQGKEARAGDMVATHYAGTLANGKKFDSSYERGQPFAFILGGGMVIKGWDIGVEGMKVGGKRKLIIPSALGYGKQGAGNGAIPPDATLFFDIELVAVQAPGR